MLTNIEILNLEQAHFNINEIWNRLNKDGPPEAISDEFVMSEIVAEAIEKIEYIFEYDLRVPSSFKNGSTKFNSSEVL